MSHPPFVPECVSPGPLASTGGSKQAGGRVPFLNRLCVSFVAVASTRDRASVVPRFCPQRPTHTAGEGAHKDNTSFPDGKGDASLGSAELGFGT